MNKEKIVDLVKRLQAEICKKCNADYDTCSKCKVHIYTNNMVEELNGN